jgi:hypothetical protein
VKLLKQRAGRGFEIHDVGAGLTVKEPEAFALEIDVIPAQIDDLERLESAARV